MKGIRSFSSKELWFLECVQSIDQDFSFFYFETLWRVVIQQITKPSDIYIGELRSEIKLWNNLAHKRKNDIEGTLCICF